MDRICVRAQIICFVPSLFRKFYCFQLQQETCVCLQFLSNKGGPGKFWNVIPIIIKQQCDGKVGRIQA